MLSIETTQNILHASQILTQAQRDFMAACEQVRGEVQPVATINRPKIGEYLAGQGGIYNGDILGDDGVLYGLIVATEDAGKAQWGSNGALDLSDWDGLSNTNALRDKSPAAKLAADYERDGHCDFYLPARREMMVALANCPKIFNKESWYWTSSPRSENYAWAVDFEDGLVSYGDRRCEFRVRPFRRFSI